jgi:transitional endoplasmic reticulum ATPase
MANSEELAIRELGFYVRNCARGPAAKRLERVLLEKVNRLKGISEDDDDGVDLSSVARRARLGRELRSILGRFEQVALPGDPAIENISFACREFGLDCIEAAILLLLMRYERNSELKSFVDEIEARINAAPEIIAILIGEASRNVDARLGRDSRLVACGLVKLEDEGCRGIGSRRCVRLSWQLRRVMFHDFRSRAAWIAALAGPVLKPELAWDDCAHLGEAADLVRHVLIGAARARAKGINILLHGPVGTGKTEFCKVLAAECGLSLRAAAEADENENDNEPERLERLASLKLLQRLLGARRNGVILFDEAEDLLEQPGAFFGAKFAGRNGSKVHINRLLEANPVPVLWTCNDVQSIDPAVLRRMTLAVEVKTPGEPARARIWRRALSLARLTLDDAAIARLAHRFEAPAAVAANAARAAALAKGGEKEIERALTGVLDLLNVSPRPPGQSDLVFDAAFINCAEDVAALAGRLSRPGAPLNWSLCLSGPPGTGKSEYARYIARRIGIETMHRRASDLLSMWVGGSEKQIAAAFAEARDKRSMLIIDEADSLLSDRRGAVRSWEVTQVNEMLTWMEQHPFPFVCTTNLAERLDQASLRRFTLKLRFEPLAREQARRLFEHAFGNSAPPALPEALTPGDFATVTRRTRLFGAADPAQLAEWLAQEVEARGQSPLRIGFVA